MCTCVFARFFQKSVNFLYFLALFKFTVDFQLRDKLEFDGEFASVSEPKLEPRKGAKDSSRWWSGVAAQPPVQHKKKMEPGATERSDAA